MSRSAGFLLASMAVGLGNMILMAPVLLKSAEMNDGFVIFAGLYGASLLLFVYGAYLFGRDWVK